MYEADASLKPTTAPVRRIRRLQLGVMSPAEIKRMSVTQAYSMHGGSAVKSGIYEYESKRNGIPIYGGLMDPRLGATRHTMCKTCLGDRFTCPGHFGHIELQVGSLNFHAPLMI
jgi:DNA-directed RNA polymerase beta' subunit